jgi:regulator of replication initiation timing
MTMDPKEAFDYLMQHCDFSHVRELEDIIDQLREGLKQQEVEITQLRMENAALRRALELKS